MLPFDVALSSPSASFRIRLSGLFLIKTNLELRISHTAATAPWMSDQHGLLPTQNKQEYTISPSVGFEPTIPVFESVEILHDSVRPTLSALYGQNYEIVVK
jgi:hypothetical protein